MTKSKINWTDTTWSPITGCTKVSDGCKHCYAEREVETRWSKNPKSIFFGRKFTDVQCHPEQLDKPLHWKKPQRIFVCPRADLFHESVPDEFLDRVFAVMAQANQHTFQVLTKRPERMRDYMNGKPQGRVVLLGGKFQAGTDIAPFVWPLPNVHLGITIENQDADKRITLLLQTSAAVRWVSVEPMLGPVSLRGFLPFSIVHGMTIPENAHKTFGGIDWIVCGGESGPNARPIHPDWARTLRDQCKTAGVPFFFKQWGEWAPVGPIYSDDDTDDHLAAMECDPDEPGQCWINPSGQIEDEGHQPPIGTMAMRRVGARRAGRLLDGVLHDEYPNDIECQMVKVIK